MNQFATPSLRCFTTLLLAAALGGCASMSKEECLTADWYEQGMRAAMSGDARTRIERDREACREVSVVPDRQQYFSGYDMGLMRFCTPENGAYWGRSGRYYGQTCPVAIEPIFLESYRAGYRVYEAEQELERLYRAQRDRQYRLERSKDDAERKALRAELIRLDYIMRDAREQLYWAEQRLSEQRY